MSAKPRIVSKEENMSAWEPPALALRIGTIIGWVITVMIYALVFWPLLHHLFG